MGERERGWIKSGREIERVDKEWERDREGG